MIEPQPAKATPTTIAHLSDVHFGRIAYPGIVQTLIDEVNALGVDLVVVSGDLTQRAMHRQFRKAAAMLQAFHAPTLVIPGNHDVYAWWYPWARLAYPVRRYQQLITAELFPQAVLKNIAVLGINSAFGATVKGGRITTAAQQRVRAFFSAQPADKCKILVVHHHLTHLAALVPHDVAQGGMDTLAVAQQVGVELILCGHLHVSHIEPAHQTPTGRQPMIVSAGTATSNRGRHSNQGKNYYNVLEVTANQVKITERRYEQRLEEFVLDKETVFPR